jgi:hypothetical protein
VLDTDVPVAVLIVVREVERLVSSDRLAAPGAVNATLLRRSVPRRNMIHMTYLDVRPGKLVQVLVDGTWHDGTLEAWRRTDGRWRGYVRWSVGVGMRHLGWVDQEQLRPVKAT